MRSRLALSFLIAIPALNPVILSPVPFLSHGPDVRLRIVTFDNNAAYLRLEQVRPTETRAPPASNAINVPWPASTMRHDDQIFQAVLAGEVKVHATRQPVNMKTLKVSMNNIQRSLKLKTGTGAGWSDEADDWLIRVLAPPKQKRTNIPGDKQALEDADDVLAIENIKSEASSVD